MENSRRSFLKIAGISAMSVGFTAPVLDAFASSDAHGGKSEAKTKHGKNAKKAEHWGMVVDTRMFHSEKDIEPIVEACHEIHNVPDFSDVPEKIRKRHEIKWIWEEEYKHVFPGLENDYLSDRVKHTPFLVLCNHCEEPSCVKACPTKATFKREDGIVLMDFHRCIGCRFCMAACPYGSRSFNFRDPRPHINHVDKGFPTRMKGVVEKCNFCAERLAQGKMPACVEASKGKIAFGDLEDPHSNVRKLLKTNYTIRRKTGLGTGPSVYYIV